MAVNPAASVSCIEFVVASTIFYTIPIPIPIPYFEVDV